MAIEGGGGGRQLIRIISRQTCGMRQQSATVGISPWQKVPAESRRSVLVVLHTRHCFCCPVPRHGERRGGGAPIHHPVHAEHALRGLALPDSMSRVNVRYEERPARARWESPVRGEASSLSMCCKPSPIQSCFQARMSMPCAIAE